MEFFAWNACFETGVTRVDEQHRHLVNLVNRFGSLLLQATGASAREVETLFNELADYAGSHFKAEEELMRAAGVDAGYREQHALEHRGFLVELGAMQRHSAAGGYRDARLLLNFLTDWLACHILGCDQSMARQMAAIADGVAPDQARRAAHQERDPATTILLASLDRLVQHVNDRNRALVELNRTLEARVAERTRELVEANAQLEGIALTDSLTGLANRRQALRVLQREWEAVSRSGRPLACLMIDADGFKFVNDFHGHAAGDEVLREIGRCIAQSVRTDDTACRLGGDEFLVICANTPAAGAIQLAELLRRQVRAQHLGAGSWQASISVGVAVRDPSMERSDDLLKAADSALYKAKRAGRNRVAGVDDLPARHCAA